ncbi:hypothetical protein FPQ18DRAFT_171772 [Pyronema domesticum]|nr:hypothetical protein FPQ18DRAFT_171772 [Pyronema domesticum]
MFLWVSLIIEDSRETPLEGIQSKLRNLPSELSGLYQQLLDQLSRRQDVAKMASKLLMWVVHAPRPMSVEELAWAYTINNDHKSRSSVDAALIRDFHFNIKLCEPILKLGDDGTIRLVHQSAKEFLAQNDAYCSADTSLKFRSPMESAYCMAITCLTYLSFEDFSMEALTRQFYAHHPESQNYICYDPDQDNPGSP